MPEIPNTESQTVATLAIAWEIVKMTYITGKSAIARKNGDEGLKELTNAVIKAFTAIYNKEAIQ